MPMFFILMNWTDQGIRAIKEARQRAEYGRKLGKKFKVEYKALYMTTGDSDLVAIVDAPNGGQRRQIRARTLLARKRSDAHLQSLA